MDKALQRQQTTIVTKENWQNVLGSLPVKADLHPAEVLNLQTPELSTINRGTGSKENGIMVFEVLILGLCEFFGEIWTPFQIRDCAELFYSEYYWLQMAELKHFTLRAKRGDLRQDIRKFTPASLSDWLGDYASQSLQERANRSVSGLDNQKRISEEAGNIITVLLDSPSGQVIEAKEKLDEFFDQFKKEKIEELQQAIRKEDPAKREQELKQSAEKLKNVNMEEVLKQFKK